MKNLHNGNSNSERWLVLITSHSLPTDLFTNLEPENPEIAELISAWNCETTNVMTLKV